MIALAIMMLIAALAIPGLNRARAAANESSAIGSLRIVNSAQVSYTVSCGSGFYAPSLTVLGTAPLANPGDGFISPDLGFDPATKSSYLVTFTPGAIAPVGPASCNGVAAGSLVWTYYVGADPLSGGGARYFGINQGGTIYFGTGSGRGDAERRPNRRPGAPVGPQSSVRPVLGGLLPGSVSSETMNVGSRRASADWWSLTPPSDVLKKSCMTRVEKPRNPVNDWQERG